jgi:hypothetical protein
MRDKGFTHDSQTGVNQTRIFDMVGGKFLQELRLVVDTITLIEDLHYAIINSVNHQSAKIT